MALWIFLTLLTVAGGFGFAILWRRQAALSAEIAQLREALAEAEAAQAAPRRRRSGEIAPVDAEIVPLPSASPAERAARAWRIDDAGLAFPGGDVQPSTLRGLALGAAAAAPALGFFIGAASALIVAAGLCVALAMTLLGLRYEWRASAWAGVVTGAGWALVGFVLGAAHQAPVIYSVFVSFCGVAGLAHAHLRRAAPGSVLALAMATLALALASQIGVISPAGAAFSCIVAAAAIVGALSLRLEALHLAAFGAALIGLFVLSGQDAAAIWFTPAASWAGALFLAIAFTRVPHLGPRGVALAGTGALAPLLAIGALHFAQHGLANPLAAAGAFAALAGVLGVLTALAAQRRRDGVGALKVTLWVLTLGAFVAIAAAISLALQAPFAGPAFAAVALGLCILNVRFPDGTWRFFALAAALLAGASALQSAQLLLTEAPAWPSWALIGSGVAVPGALLAAAAFFARRADAHFTEAVFEALGFALFIAAASLSLRVFFADGAMLSAPIGFVETGAHVSAWLLAALLIATRAKGGARTRIASATVIGAVSLVVALVAGLLWVTPYWTAREVAGAPLAYAPLGFLAPAALFFAHWVFWRARGSEVRTRTVFAASALLAAGFIALEVLRHSELPAWASALIAAVTFALAISVNFAPGIVGASSGSYGDENFHRNRRRK